MGMTPWAGTAAAYKEIKAYRKANKGNATSLFFCFTICNNVFVVRAFIGHLPEISMSFRDTWSSSRTLVRTLYAGFDVYSQNIP